MLPLPDIRPTSEFNQGRRVSVLKTKYLLRWRGFNALIPAGFRSDLSSVPRCLNWFIAHDDQGFMEAGLVHDWCYRQGPYTRAMADLLFRELLRESGVSWFKAWSAYLALRCFGKRNYTTQRLILFAACLLLFCASAAHAETVLLQFSHDRCPYCRVLDRSFADPQVQSEMIAAKATRRYLDTNGMTEAQLVEWKVTGVPVLVLGETDEQGRVREVRRLNGGATPNQLRAFIRGGGK